MPTDSHYAAHCREVCDGCAKGFSISEGFLRQGRRLHIVSKLGRCEPCTALTIEQFAEQQARIAEIRRVKLEHAGEALEKRREQVQKGRLMLLNAARSLQSYDASYGGGGGDSEAWAIADFCGYDPDDSRADSDLEAWLSMQLMKETLRSI